MERPVGIDWISGADGKAYTTRGLNAQPQLAQPVQPPIVQAQPILTNGKPKKVEFEKINDPVSLRDTLFNNQQFMYSFSNMPEDMRSDFLIKFSEDPTQDPDLVANELFMERERLERALQENQMGNTNLEEKAKIIDQGDYSEGEPIKKSIKKDVPLSELNMQQFKKFGDALVPEKTIENQKDLINFFNTGRIS